jgi:hypothetical protein
MCTHGPGAVVLEGGEIFKLRVGFRRRSRSQFYVEGGNGEGNLHGHGAEPGGPPGDRLLRNSGYLHRIIAGVRLFTAAPIQRNHLRTEFLQSQRGGGSRC